jgi:glutathione synthase/RimK-type ligase-like ATP-grasp enzyme
MRGERRTLTDDLWNGDATRRRTERRPNRPLRPKSLGVLVEQRYLSHAQPAGMVAALRARGHDVFTIDPEAIAAEAGDPDWLYDIDLVVGRGRSLALLCLLTWAESCGARTINRRAAIAAVHNKAEMAVRLAAEGLPTPKTFLGHPGELAATVPRDSYPLILKPSFGDNCQGLELVEGPGELASLSWPEPLVLAQEFLPTDGNDLKLYVVGGEVWAVRKPSPLTDRNGAPELIAQTPELTQLARRCGDLFGLELYGVDCLETEAGTVVVEVNEFPNYTGVPDADDTLADYVLARAEAEVAR